jgi:transposase-like protein
MQKRQKIGSYPAEFRERAVRLVQESEASYPSRWAALLSVSGKVGCSAEILSWTPDFGQEDKLVSP